MSDGPLSFQRSWEGFLPPNTVIMAKRGAPVAPGDSATALEPEIRFGFEAPDVSEPAAHELLDKILSALELRAGDYAVFPRAPENFGGRILVSFSAGETDAKRAGVWENSRLTTYSLRAMLGNPGLKKPVWAHLKEAIARVQSTDRKNG